MKDFKKDVEKIDRALNRALRTDLEQCPQCKDIVDPCELHRHLELGCEIARLLTLESENSTGT